MWVHNTVKFDVLFYRCQLNISHSNFCTFLFLFFTPSNICRMVALKDFAWMYLHLQNGRANIFHSTCKLVFAFICCVNKNCSVPLTELTKPCVLILSSPLKSARSLLVVFCFFVASFIFSIHNWTTILFQIDRNPCLITQRKRLLYYHQVLDLFGSNKQIERLSSIKIQPNKKQHERILFMRKID